MRFINISRLQCNQLRPKRVAKYKQLLPHSINYSKSIHSLPCSNKQVVIIFIVWELLRVFLTCLHQPKGQVQITSLFELIILLINRVLGSLLTGYELESVVGGVGMDVQASVGNIKICSTHHNYFT